MIDMNWFQNSVIREAEGKVHSLSCIYSCCVKCDRAWYSSVVNILSILYFNALTRGLNSSVEGMEEFLCRVRHKPLDWVVVVVVVNLYFLQLHEDFTTKDERKKN